MYKFKLVADKNKRNESYLDLENLRVNKNKMVMDILKLITNKVNKRGLAYLDVQIPR